MNYELKVRKVLTIPQHNGHQEVISVVEWDYIFTDGINEAISSGETLLTLPETAQAFIPLQAVTKGNIEAWILQEYNSTFLEELQSFHAVQFEYKNRVTEASGVADLAFIEPRLESGTYVMETIV